MNFFAHLVVAASRSREEPFVFGAMLPDLGSMGRFRWTGIHDDLTRSGLDHHHETDRVFHALPVFRDLTKLGQSALSPLELRPTLVRGLAHIAVELLLDGELSGRTPDISLFRRAITGDAQAPRSPWGVELETESAQRWHRLRDRLLGGALPGAYQDPSFVAERIIGICRARPRLVLPDGIAPELSRWTAALQKDVKPKTDELLEGVLAHLG